MIELFSVINQLQKGALGLFFELNYLIGIFLTGYISWFTFHFKGPFDDGSADTTVEYQHQRMYDWLTFQYFYTYFSVIFMFMITWMYRKMDGQAQGVDLATGVEANPKGEMEMMGINNSAVEAE